jgi:hypothetical protein
METTNTKKPPDVIYHYCDLPGFKGIVEGKTIWLSDVRFCNDYMEHNWLKEMFDREIETLRHQQQSGFHDALAEEKANYREHLAFVACFSEENDLLSQWRAYADDGAGIAIGFNTQYFELNQFVPTYGIDSTVTHGLVKVCYDTDEQKQLVMDIINRYREESEQESADVSKVAADCYFNLQMASIACKNPAFKEEKEWRIVYRPMIQRSADGLNIRGGNDQIAFRTSRGNVIPYFKFSIAETKAVQPVREVVRGPRQGPTTGSDVLAWLFEHNDLQVKSIACSEATYR